jgi:hypothetical protein
MSLKLWLADASTLAQSLQIHHIKRVTYVCMRVFTFSRGVCKGKAIGVSINRERSSAAAAAAAAAASGPERMISTHHCQSCADSRGCRSYLSLVLLEESVASRFIHDPGVAGWHDGGLGVGRWREGRSMFSSFTNSHALKRFHWTGQGLEKRRACSFLHGIARFYEIPAIRLQYSTMRLQPQQAGEPNGTQSGLSEALRVDRSASHNSASTRLAAVWRHSLNRYRYDPKGSTI